MRSASDTGALSAAALFASDAKRGGIQSRPFGCVGDASVFQKIPVVAEAAASRRSRTVRIAEAVVAGHSECFPAASVGGRIVSRMSLMTVRAHRSVLMARLREGGRCGADGHERDGERCGQRHGRVGLEPI